MFQGFINNCVSLNPDRVKDWFIKVVLIKINVDEPLTKFANVFKCLSHITAVIQMRK